MHDTDPDHYSHHPEDRATIKASRPRPPKRFSRRVRDTRIRRYRRAILEVAPDLDNPRFRPILESFCRISLLGLDTYEYLQAQGIAREGNANGSAELRDAVRHARQLFDSQLKFAMQLGLTPVAYRLTAKQVGPMLDLPATLAQLAGGETAEASDDENETDFE